MRGGEVERGRRGGGKGWEGQLTYQPLAPASVLHVMWRQPPETYTHRTHMRSASPALLMTTAPLPCHLPSARLLKPLLGNVGFLSRSFDPSRSPSLGAVPFFSMGEEHLGHFLVISYMSFLVSRSSLDWMLDPPSPSQSSSALHGTGLWSPNPHPAGGKKRTRSYMPISDRLETF